MRLQDGSEKFFLVESDCAKMRGELIEQLRVARGVCGPQIVHRVDDTDTEKFGPDAVNGDLGKRGV